MVFAFLFVYAPTDREDREVCWWELDHNCSILPGSWILCGDFNVTLSSDERNGRNGSPRDIKSFRDFISSASLIDLPLSVRTFTWSNKRLKPSMARLDRFLINYEWENKFPSCIQFSLPAFGSDHFPIILNSGGLKTLPPIFRFERSWLHNTDFIPFVSRCWHSFQGQGSSVNIFILKLKLLKRRLKWWKKNVLGCISTRKSEALSKVNAFDLLEEQRPLLDSEFNERKANFIATINHQGRDIIGDDDVSKAFHKYYYELFGQSNSKHLHTDWSTLYPQQENNLLSLEDKFTEVEIKSAVLGMNANIALGLDGFSMAFYQLFGNWSRKSMLDSIIQANKMSHVCSKRKKEVAMFKIDFAKAFDSIDWVFLIEFLKARGFDNKWCSWILHIISSSNCAVLVNGSPSKFLYYKRGLKQGDPLSSMLFNIVVDALNRMIMNNVEEGLLSSLGLREPLNQLRILQFADILLFVKSSSNDIFILKTILYIFEEISGLSINYSKSSLIYFGKIHHNA
ncbi:uncharacterized protein LOC109838323 [Asparagus officinalis]|uniref:uncharacterized protein LOC109838323 n=1 Tax=Asparagus officinalis TaxID=4686 RepID=UPI00098E2B26|nr:uncharacterized protein LOC109838323 [Asparagus officinalis]